MALVLLFLLPMCRVLATGLYDQEGLTLKHLAHFFSAPVYVRVLVTTIYLSAAATFLSLVLGYVIAYAASRFGRRGRAVVLTCVMMSFGVSLLVRVFSMAFLLKRTGVVNSCLIFAGIIGEPLPLMYNQLGVILGLTHLFVPFAVFPILSVLNRIEPSHFWAAASLGASRMRTFFEVTLPLSLPGVWAGGLLIFVMALGSFVTPAILGGRKEQMLANLIQAQVVDLVNWPFASAMSLVLMAVSCACYWVAGRLFSLEAMLNRGGS